VHSIPSRGIDPHAYPLPTLPATRREPLPTSRDGRDSFSRVRLARVPPRGGKRRPKLFGSAAMEEPKPEVSTGRSKRALALIGLALVVLAVTAGSYLWRGATSTDRAPAPLKTGGTELVDMASVS